MPLATCVELNDPMVSFQIIKTTAEKIRDLNALNALIKKTFCLGEKMIVAVWCENVNYLIFGISQTVCDMETRRLYKEHLIKLYEDIGRKVSHSLFRIVDHLTMFCSTIHGHVDLGHWPI